jgi:hypothetical protein
MRQVYVVNIGDNTVPSLMSFLFDNLIDAEAFMKVRNEGKGGAEPGSYISTRTVYEKFENGELS